MPETKGFKRRPQTHASDADRFIAGAGNPAAGKATPWDGLREDVIKPFNLRLNEVQRAQIELIVSRHPDHNSIHSWLMAQVQRGIANDLERAVSHDIK